MFAGHVTSTNSKKFLYNLLQVLVGHDMAIEIFLKSNLRKILYTECQSTLFSPTIDAISSTQTREKKSRKNNPENATRPTGQGNSVENREQVMAVET